MHETYTYIYIQESLDIDITVLWRLAHNVKRKFIARWIAVKENIQNNSIHFGNSNIRHTKWYPFKSENRLKNSANLIS